MPSSRLFALSTDLQRVTTGQISWASGTAQTVYTVPSLPLGSAFVLQDALLRNPVGTQPLTVTVRVSGASAFGAVSLTSLSAGLALSLARGAGAGPVTVATTGQAVTVTPATATTGSVTIDLMGYFVDD